MLFDAAASKEQEHRQIINLCVTVRGSPFSPLIFRIDRRARRSNFHDAAAI